MPGSDPRASRPSGHTHGERRRRQILAAALDLSSAEGLAGLSIGRLAAEVGMSKSGLFAHFGSKEELQIAAIEAASQAFEERVRGPAFEAEPGLARLRALLGCWLAYLETGPFRGGCFFFATSSEFGSRPGPVRDALARVVRAWIRDLEREARVAQRQSELNPEIDPAQLIFRLHAFVQEANWADQLLADGDAFPRARAAIEAALRSSESQLRVYPWP